jgi:cytochrome c-type biogenesis protein
MKLRLKRSWLLLLGLMVGLAVAIAAYHIRFVRLLHPLESLIFVWEDGYQVWLDRQVTPHPLLLLPLALAGGLMASLSPCILALLPLNLSYIGISDIRSRRAAFVQASLFVLGVATTLSLLGLFSGFAGAVMVQYRGYIHCAIGLLILLMGMNLLGLFQLRLPQAHLPLSAHPYGFGLTFALVASPCASPILFAVLGAAAATGSHLLSVLTMFSYAIGYTALIFLASLFTGFAKQTKKLLVYADTVLRLSGIALSLLGLYYLISGIAWIS